MKIKITALSILKVLLGVFVLLLLANCLVLFYKFNADNPNRTFIRLFDFNSEVNVPTFYSYSLIIVGAVLAAFIGIIFKRSENRIYRYWLGLAWGFLFIAFDELVQIHELLTETLRENFDLDGFLYYSWVLPYGTIIIVFGVIFTFGFLRYLPAKLLRMVVLSAAIYLMGAIGFEVLGGNVDSSQGSEILYAVLYTFEESFEIIGVTLFIYTLLNFCQNDLKVTIEAKGDINDIIPK